MAKSGGILWSWNCKKLSSMADRREIAAPPVFWIFSSFANDKIAPLNDQFRYSSSRSSPGLLLLLLTHCRHLSIDRSAEVSLAVYVLSCGRSLFHLTRWTLWEEEEEEAGHRNDNKYLLVFSPFKIILNWLAGVGQWLVGWLAMGSWRRRNIDDFTFRGNCNQCSSHKDNGKTWIKRIVALRYRIWRAGNDFWQRQTNPVQWWWLIMSSVRCGKQKIDLPLRLSLSFCNPPSLKAILHSITIKVNCVK